MGCNKSLYWIKAIHYGNISIYGADTVADGTLPLISFPANKKAHSWRQACRRAPPQAKNDFFPTAVTQAIDTGRPCGSPSRLAGRKLDGSLL